jgi:glycosyltransferase involved in cell wall biosynthesis
MKVDVILPVYKGKQWVGEAIDSVLSQRYPNWHLTLVDDASPDDTAEHVEHFCHAYPQQISLIRLKENRRAAGARMEAVRCTKSEVIAFLDQDDRWAPEKLARQIQRFEAWPPVEAVHTDVVHIDAEGNRLARRADWENARRASVPYENLSKEELTRLLFLSHSIRLVTAAVLRKSFEGAGGFNEALFGGEDWEFWIRFASTCRIGHIAEPLVERRIHDKNTSVHYARSRISGAFAALDKVKVACPHLSALAYKRRANLLKQAVVAALENNRVEEAREIARLLVRARPLDVSTFLLFALCYAGPYKKVAMGTADLLRLWVSKVGSHDGRRNRALQESPGSLKASHGDILSHEDC